MIPALVMAIKNRIQRILQGRFSHVSLRIRHHLLIAHSAALHRPGSQSAYFFPAERCNWRRPRHTSTWLGTIPLGHTGIIRCVE